MRYFWVAKKPVSNGSNFPVTTVNVSNELTSDIEVSTLLKWILLESQTQSVYYRPLLMTLLTNYKGGSAKRCRRGGESTKSSKRIKFEKNLKFENNEFGIERCSTWMKLKKKQVWQESTLKRLNFNIVCYTNCHF